MKPVISCIYKITNKQTGKVYVGSAKDVGTRWSSHIYDLDRNKHHSKELQEDWNKYGFINFSFDILDLNTIDLLATEQYYIELYDSIKSGYNSMNAIKSKLIETALDISDILTEYEIENIIKNIRLIGNPKTRTIRPALNYSHSLKWYSKNENINILIKNIRNVYRNQFKTSHGNKNCAWVVYDSYVGKISINGNTDSFSSEFKRLDRKNKYLIYAMNIFPNANMNIDKDDYALYNILNWIKNNGDIEHEFYLYCSSERMEYLVGKFIGLWKDENEWVNYHKL